ncbi:MAG: RIP metalloprotease RseP [Bacteroidota bacterium]
MEVVVMITQLILALSILVILHEFGHFIAARAFGIRVEKFYLFFNWKFSLVTYKKGEGIRFLRFHRSTDKISETNVNNTTYGIGWIPLGGFVKISGMIDESMDKEQMKQPPQPWEFRSKPAWQRLIVMTGGVIMNAILGILVLSYILLQYTKEYLPKDEVNKDGIYAYEKGREIGFKQGDKVLQIDGKDFERFGDVLSYKVLFGADVTIERDGKQQTIQIPDTFYKSFKNSFIPIIEAHNFKFQVDSFKPGYNAEINGMKSGDKIKSVNDIEISCFGHMKEVLFKNKGKDINLVVERSGNFDTLIIPVDTNGLIGFYQSHPDYKYAEYTVGKSFKYGTSDAIMLTIANIKGLGKIVSGQENASESVAGPIRIATMFGGTWIWERFWRLVGLLSLVLAFMNILPIPALDGGHVILLLIEWISGRKIPDKVMEKIQMVGMIIIMALMIFIFGNDIFRLFK